MPNTPHADIHSKITNQIIKAIEAGAGNWKMPWHTDGNDTLRPVNAISGKPYRGVNVLALWCVASDHGYGSDKWATFKQWQESGAAVRKGEKASSIVFWKFTDADHEADTTNDENATHRRVFERGYSVFNAEQVEGYQAPPIPARPEIQRIKEAEQFFNGLGADIRSGGNRAFYRPTTDHIQMPNFESFRDAVAYYATLSHEVTHWTGAKERLDRDLSKRFGSEAYAGEELVAELGAAFLCADLGLANEPRPDHAAYVANWLKALRSDTRAIFTAAAKAQQAVDYAHSLQQPQPARDLEIVQPSQKGQFSLNF
jgi:antirestriction protein ArdC